MRNYKFKINMLKLSLTAALFLGLCTADKLIGFELYDNATDFQCYKNNSMNFVLTNGYSSEQGVAPSVINNI